MKRRERGRKRRGKSKGRVKDMYDEGRKQRGEEKKRIQGEEREKKGRSTRKTFRRLNEDKKRTDDE